MTGHAGRPSPSEAQAPLRFGILAVLAALVLFNLSGAWLVGLLTLIPLGLVLWAVSIPALLVAVSWAADARPQQHTFSRVRPLDLSTQSGWSACVTAASKHDVLEGFAKARLLPLHPNSTEVSEAGEELITLIIRDFVRKWHDLILEGEEPSRFGGDVSVQASGEVFPAATALAIRHALLEILARAEELDMAQLAVMKILPAVVQHLHGFRQAETSVQSDAKGTRLTQGDHVLQQDELFIASRYLSGKLHPAVGSLSNPSSKATEQVHLRSLAERALHAVLPRAELQSRAVFVTVRELVACTVLQPIIEMLSDSDFFNQLVNQKVGFPSALHSCD